MDNTYLLNEILWIINTINKYKLIALEDLSQMWKEEVSNGIELNRLTFYRRKVRIKEMFDIEIGCKKKNKKYYYYLRNENQEIDSVQKWIISTFSLNDALNNGKDVYNRIILETVNIDNKKLTICIDAMKSGKCIDINYHKYSFAESRDFRLEPYCIKLFQQRWYLLAHMTHKDNMAIFAFDRIKSIAITEQKYVMDPNFNPKQYFRDCYGIVKADIPCERITMRVYGTQQFYLRDLPLHHSQKVLGVGDNYTDFEYHMYPTGDLKGKILSLADTIQVLSPEWFAKDIKKTILNTAQRYENIHLSLEEE